MAFIRIKFDSRVILMIEKNIISIDSVDSSHNIINNLHE